VFFFLLQPEQLALAAAVPVRQAVPAPPAAAAGQAQPAPLPPTAEPAPHPSQSAHRRSLQSVLPARLATDDVYIYIVYIHSPASQTRVQQEERVQEFLVAALNSHWIPSQDGRPISKSYLEKWPPPRL
jgi:hypothetical protein